MVFHQDRSGLEYWGPFLERPGKLTGPVSYFEIEVSRKVGCVLTSNEVHFVSLAENLNCIIFKSFETPIWNGKQNSLTGPAITGSFEKRAPGRGDCVARHFTFIVPLSTQAPVVQTLDNASV